MRIEWRFPKKKRKEFQLTIEYHKVMKMKAQKKAAANETRDKLKKATVDWTGKNKVRAALEVNESEEWTDCSEEDSDWESNDD